MDDDLKHIKRSSLLSLGQFQMRLLSGLHLLRLSSSLHPNTGQPHRLCRGDMLGIIIDYQSIMIRTIVLNPMDAPLILVPRPRVSGWQLTRRSRLERGHHFAGDVTVAHARTPGRP